MLNKIKNSPHYRWFVAAAVFVGTFMSTLDSSIVNVALPTIAGQFKADLTMLQWVVTAYLLTITSLLPIFGRIADLIGRKKIYTLGFLIFTLGSGLCGLAQGLWFLVAARVLQAVGAAMMMSNSFALIVNAFPPRERGKALGMSGSVVALGSLTGPALGGVLIGLAGWPSIFYINLPIGVLGFVASVFILPADQPRKEQGSFDYGGAILFSVGIVSLLFAILNGTDWGWLSVPVLSGMLIGVLLLIGFFIVEKKVRHPMIDLRLFKSMPFLIGNISGWLCFLIMYTNNMLLPFYLQRILHYEPSQAGFLMMAFPVMMAIVAPISGHVSDKFGPVLLTTGGLACMALGMLYYSTLPSVATFYRVLPGPLLMGLGAGLFQSPNNSSVMSAVPAHKSGIAGSIISLVRNVGMVTGIAFSVTLFEVLGGTTTPSAEQVSTFMSAYHGVMLTAMAIALAAMLISFSRKGYTQASAAKDIDV